LHSPACKAVLDKFKAGRNLLSRLEEHVAGSIVHATAGLHLHLLVPGSCNPHWQRVPKMPPAERRPGNRSATKSLPLYSLARTPLTHDRQKPHRAAAHHSHNRPGVSLAALARAAGIPLRPRRCPCSLPLRCRFCCRRRRCCCCYPCCRNTRPTRRSCCCCLRCRCSSCRRHRRRGWCRGDGASPDAGIVGAEEAGAEDVAQQQRLLVRHVSGRRRQRGVCQRHPAGRNGRRAAFFAALFERHCIYCCRWCPPAAACRVGKGTSLKFELPNRQQCHIHQRHPARPGGAPSNASGGRILGT
jgi:hypothetical protein